MKQVTLQDIANELNISKTTVSKALKGYKDVSKATRKAVKKLAKELNYSPNSTAVNLRLQQTKIIGVIVPTIVHQFFSKVIEGIIEKAEKKGYFVIILQSNENAKMEAKQLKLLMDKRVDGILISLSNQTNRCNHLQEIIDKGTPLVMFDKINKLINCSKVVINDYKAAYNAVTYLIKKGYKRIAHFRGALIPQNSIDRFLGYRQALLDHNIPFDPTLVYICDKNDDFKDGYISAKKLINDHSDVDAIFTITDVIAVGVLKYFKEKNIQVPKDIAVFGFSDWFMSSVITPTLSSVKQPDFKMGKKAASILISEIKNNQKQKEFSFQNIELSTSMIIREST